MLYSPSRNMDFWWIGEEGSVNGNYNNDKAGGHCTQLNQVPQLAVVLLLYRGAQTELNSGG
jgi:hypothetical protein